MRHKVAKAVAVAGLAKLAQGSGCLPENTHCSTCDGGVCTDCDTGYELFRAKADAAPTKCIASCIGKDAPPKPGMPTSPFTMNGKVWPQKCVDQSEAYFFGIGDWGGDRPGGGTWTNPGKCAGVAEGVELGEVSNHTREYNEKMVSFAEAEWGHHWKPHVRRCAWWDHWAQSLVAKEMQKQAEANKRLDFVLNAGDNFYPGGINTWCGQFGNHVPWDPSHQFVNNWQNVYLKGAMKDAPWISCLGNHDWGGISHHQGWDVQVFFTWKHDQWTMPAMYYNQVIQYRDFSIKVFVLDSNHMDCCGDAHHKICQGGGDCWGMSDGACVGILRNAWGGSLQMLEDGLKESTSEYHFIVTHFPAPSIAGNGKIRELDRKYGIDLVFTGHAHYQGMSMQSGMVAIISGGGGGATTDASNCEWCPGYGFVSFHATATEMNIQLINWKGHVNSEKKVYPKAPKKRLLGDAEAEQLV